MKTRLGMRLMALSLVLIGIKVGWAQTPVKGGTFVFGRGADSVGLDPAVVTDGESFRVTRNVYESLLDYKRDSTEVVAGLAASWVTSPTGLEWKFELRRHVKFHDGTPFNAEAVVFNFERWMFEQHPYHKGVFEYWQVDVWRLPWLCEIGQSDRRVLRGIRPWQTDGPFPGQSGHADVRDRQPDGDQEARRRLF